METVRRILEIACFAADGLALLGIPVSLYLHSQFKQKGKRSKLPAVLGIVLILLALVMNIGYFLIAVKTYQGQASHMEELPSFTVTSENLHDGTWDDSISNTDAGENKSPQLSWEAVAGAKAYGILMIDPDGSNWLHWKTPSVTQTALPLGFADAESYVGPYPPEGQTHTYTIYVVAMKAPKTDVMGALDCPNDEDIPTLLRSFDIGGDGKPGNALAVGTLTGTYTRP